MDARRMSCSMMWLNMLEAPESPAPSNENWGSVIDAPSTSEDWDFVANAVTDSADWGAV